MLCHKLALFLAAMSLYYDAVDANCPDDETTDEPTDAPVHHIFYHNSSVNDAPGAAGFVDRLLSFNL